MQSLREQVATGYKIINPSDAPGKAGTIVQFQNLINRLDRHKERISYAENMLTQQELVVSDAADLMVRAKELAQQVTNETYSVEQRRQLATEVWSIRDAMVAAGNTRVLGKYIYGGNDDDDPPFDLGPAPYTNPPGASVSANRHYIFDAEQGTANTRSVNITDDEILRVNTTGTIFNSAINSLERLGRALEGYRTTPEQSTSTPDLGGVAFTFPADYHAQTSALQNALDQIDTSKDAFITEQSDLGARMNRLTQARSLVDSVREATEKNRVDIQDADLAEVASNLSNLQTSYQALLATGAQLQNLSLLDFL